MKPSKGRQTTQLQLAFEADESRIWETLDKSKQDQVTKVLAMLWMEYVTNQRAIGSEHNHNSTGGSTSDE